MTLGKQIFTREQLINPPTRGLVLTPEVNLLVLPSGYTALSTLATLRLVLGEPLARALYMQNPSKVLQKAAAIFSDHMQDDGVTPKNLQLNVVVHCVQGLVDRTGNQVSRLKRSAEGVLNALGLDPEFRQQVNSALFDDGVLTSKFMVLYRLAR